MSIKIMSNVWQYSQQKGSALLLLLAIADNASDSGYAFPGIDYLARKTRLSPRQVMRLVQKMEQTDELTAIRKKSHNEYVINVWPPDLKGIRYCERCKALDVPEIGAGLHKHHKIPKSQGGTDDPENIEILCKDCHELHHKMTRDKMTRDKMTRDKMTRLGDTDVTSDVTPMSPEPSLPVNESSFLEKNPKLEKQTHGTPIVEAIRENEVGEKQALNTLANRIAQLCDNINIETAHPDTIKELKRVTLSLSRQAATCDDLESFEPWWYDNTWQGQKGQAPSPKLLGDKWGQFEAARVVKVPVQSNGDSGFYL